MSAALSTIYALWLVWAVSWLIAGAWSAPTAVRASLRQAAPYRLLQFVGGVLVFYRPTGHVLGIGWPVGEAVRWAMAVLVVAGFGFCWWARIHLGRLWSGTVERKQGHHIIDTGPYRLVRHPIYAGLILAGYATAFARGGLAPLLGACALVAAWCVKARLEEGLLRQELGADAYGAYAARTPMLAPFLRLLVS